jgi:hypothetical protein
MDYEGLPHFVIEFNPELAALLKSNPSATLSSLIQKYHLEPTHPDL